MTDPMATVRQYIDGFNRGDSKAMAALQMKDGGASLVPPPKPKEEQATGQAAKPKPKPQPADKVATR